MMAGDRGMITTTRIAALRQLGGMGWLSALRAPAIAKLAADTGPLQLSLLNQADLAEFSHHDYPNARLVACRDPALAAERTANARPCSKPPKASPPPITATVLTGADKIGPRVGKVVNKHKMAKHFTITITDTMITRNQPGIDAEAGLDGTYVIRTAVPAGDLDNAVVTAYKNLAHRERGFRIRKAVTAVDSFMVAVGCIHTMKGHARCWDSADSAHTDAGRGTY